MSQDDIFDGKDTTPPVTPPSDDPNSALLTKVMEIKKEDGTPKYDTLEKAVDALVASQEYIPTLKSTLEQKEKELSELNTKLASTQSVEDVVSKLLEQNNQEPVQPEPTNQREPENKIDEADIAKIVRAEQERLAKEQQLQENANKVTTALTEKFGEKTKEEVNKKAKELGITAERLGQLATEAPDMVLSFFNVQQNQNNSTPIDDGVNTSNFQKEPPKDLAKPEKSMLSGATAKEQEEYMKKIKEKVYQDLGVEA